MIATMSIVIPMVVAILRLLHPIGGRTANQHREHIQTLVSFLLVLAVVVLATLGYLELVAVLLESIE